MVHLEAGDFDAIALEDYAIGRKFVALHLGRDVGDVFVGGPNAHIVPERHAHRVAHIGRADRAIHFERAGARAEIRVQVAGHPQVGQADHVIRVEMRQEERVDRAHRQTGLGQAHRAATTGVDQQIQATGLDQRAVAIAQRVRDNRTRSDRGDRDLVFLDGGKPGGQGGDRRHCCPANGRGADYATPRNAGFDFRGHVRLLSFSR